MEAKTKAVTDKTILRTSALWYTGTSLGVVLLFWSLTQILGGYTTPAVVGGAVWSFILSMIVTMPLYTSYFKQRRTG